MFEWKLGETFSALASQFLPFEFYKGCALIIKGRANCDLLSVSSHPNLHAKVFFFFDIFTVVCYLSEHATI